MVNQKANLETLKTISRQTMLQMPKKISLLKDIENKFTIAETNMYSLMIDMDREHKVKIQCDAIGNVRWDERCDVDDKKMTIEIDTDSDLDNLVLAGSIETELRDARPLFIETLEKEMVELSRIKKELEEEFRVFLVLDALM